jgi:hypothetical protein
VHRQGGDITAGKHDAAGVGRNQPGNLIDQRRLAGAIRPDDGVQFVRPDVEGQVIGDDEGTEFLPQAFEAQHGFSHGRTSATARP